DLAHLGTSRESLLLRWYPARSAPERSAQVADVFLRLLQQRPQRLGDVWQPELLRLLDPQAVALELLLLKVQVQSERALRIDDAGDRRHLDGGYAAQEVDLFSQDHGMRQLLAEVLLEFTHQTLHLESLEGRDVLVVLDDRSVLTCQIFVHELDQLVAVHSCTHQQSIKCN